MFGGNTAGDVHLRNTAIDFAAGAASGMLVSKGSGNTATGTIGSGMTLWINGSNSGTGTLNTVGTLENKGNIRIESSNSNWQSNLVGSLLNHAGGLVEVNQGTGGPRNLNFELDNDGTFVFRQNANLGIAGSNHDNRGLFVVETGTVDISGDSFTNNGTLKGNGTIDFNAVPFTNSGTVAPGLSAGNLTIDGDYNNDTIAILEIELAGLLAGEFDVLSVIGDASLNGTLDIDIIDGFIAQTDDRFRILTTTGSRSGVFSIEPNSDDWRVEYGSDFVEIVALREVVPEPTSGLLLLASATLLLRRRR